MRFLHKISVFFFYFYFFSSATVVGQYTITATQMLSCPARFAGVSIIYVGNGVVPQV
jgi:hypothetical protein